MEQHEPGTLINQRYRVVKSIGSGGFGAVYQAVDTGFKDRMVAVKQMLGAVENTSAAYLAERFEAECEMLERLTHSHIPQIFDHFELSGSYYLVMEFIEGITLEEWVDKTHPAPVADVLKYSLQVCQVLEYLHGQTVPLIHRDIKPQNIILRSDGDVTLVDFGLVRTLDVETTRTQVGTVGYAALEQVRGQPEPCSDIYSLGATMYHLLVGERPKPFQIPDVRTVRPDVSERAAAVVTMATQQNPARRYLTATRMRQALEAALADLSGTERKEEDIYPEISGGAEGRLPSSPVPLMVAATGVLLGLFWLMAHMSSVVDTNLHKPTASASIAPEHTQSPSADLQKTLTSLLSADTASQWAWTAEANVDAAGIMHPDAGQMAELVLEPNSHMDTLPRTLVFRLQPHGSHVILQVSSAGAQCKFEFKSDPGVWYAQLAHRGAATPDRLVQEHGPDEWSSSYALTVAPDGAELQQESGRKEVRVDPAVLATQSPAPAQEPVNGSLHVTGAGEFDPAEAVWFQAYAGPSGSVQVKDVSINHQLVNPFSQ